MSGVQSTGSERAAPIAVNELAGAAEPRGIGGWLLVVAFGQVLGSLQLLVRLVQLYLDPENLKVFEQYPLAMFGELAMNVGLLLLALVTAVLFFRKSPRFPRLFICELVAVPALMVLSVVWTAFAFSSQLGVPFSEFWGIEQQDIVQFGLAVVTALIWIPYTLKSRRVKNTFALPGTPGGVTNVRDEGQGQFLLRTVVYATFAMGLTGILAGLGHLIGRGVFSGQLIGGAVQMALAIWLFRGSEVARIILAFLFSIGLVGFIGLALWIPDQGPTPIVLMLALAMTSAACVWALIFSRRFRTELAINAAKYQKGPPENE